MHVSTPPPIQQNCLRAILSPKTARNVSKPPKMPTPPSSPGSPQSNLLSRSTQTLKNRFRESPTLARIKRAANHLLPGGHTNVEIKTMEISQVIRQNRTVFGYSEYSPAVHTSSHISPNGLEKPSLGELSASGIGLSPDAIQLRSAAGCAVQLRFGILYYQMLAYYRSGATVEIGHTSHQHGVSNVQGWSAAHAAMCPQLLDNYFSIMAEQISDRGLTQDIKKRLQALGASDEAIDRISRLRNSREIFEGIHSALKLKEKGPLLSLKHHLYNVMNCTIEGPRFWNTYDQLLERALRDTAVKLINDCSQGDTSPYEALEFFVGEFRGFLKNSHAETIKKIELIDSLTDSINEFFNLKTKLSNTLFDKSPFVDEGLRRLEEIRATLAAIAAAGEYSMKVNFKDITEPFRSLKWLSTTLVPPAVGPNGQSRSIANRKYEQKIENTYEAFNNFFQTYPQLSTEGLIAYKEQLYECATLIYVLKAHSYCPAYEQLSGKKTANGRREGLSLKELTDQQLEILRPSYKVDFSLKGGLASAKNALYNTKKTYLDIVKTRIPK